MKRPGGGVAFFKVLALPFGATGSVAAFLRISSAIAYVGTKGLEIPWSVFFDDYTALSPAGLENDTTFYAEALFKLLGINFASEGSKAPPFSHKFKTLRLVVDTERVNERTVQLGHTPERAAELLQSIDELLTQTQVSTKALEQLHGRVVWFRTFIFGRKLNAATRTISWFSRRPFPRVNLETALKQALQNLKQHLAESKRVSICRDLNETWIIFTDGVGSSHSHPASIGGVLLNPVGQVFSCFGTCLPEALLEQFLAESKHPIYELVILPLVVAVKIWAKFIFRKVVVHYLDNDAARSAFIRANASTTLGSTLIAEYINFEYKCCFSPWFARVASHSNPSDQPSRLDFTANWIQHVERIDVVLPAQLSEWGNSGCADT